ncbi:hypothetical protein SDC9_183509 [bioreactor metagenome]|uniref:Uncharacterized protein n=1 Tax=bioreactor metagenome TaxID=1076179 RepID=A0A645HIQ5_9ZZZZ
MVISCLSPFGSGDTRSPDAPVILFNGLHVADKEAMINTSINATVFFNISPSFYFPAFILNNKSKKIMNNCKESLKYSTKKKASQN